MFAVLGDIEFELTTYWDGFNVSFGVDYAEQARIQGKPGLQFVGEKLDEINIRLIFHSHYCSPTVELKRLHDAMISHQAMAMVFGNGDYRGWFVITDLKASSQHTDATGNVQSQSAEMTLREYIGDVKNPNQPPAVKGNDANIDAMTSLVPAIGSSSGHGLQMAVNSLLQVGTTIQVVTDAISQLSKFLEDPLSVLMQIPSLNEMMEQIARLLEVAKKALSSITGLIDSFKKAVKEVADIVTNIKVLLANIHDLAHSGSSFSGQLSTLGTMLTSASTLLKSLSLPLSEMTAAIATRSWAQ